jgi:hypothetical protein
MVEELSGLWYMLILPPSHLIHHELDGTLLSTGSPGYTTVLQPCPDANNGCLLRSTDPVSSAWLYLLSTCVVLSARCAKNVDSSLHARILVGHRRGMYPKRIRLGASISHQQYRYVFVRYHRDGNNERHGVRPGCYFPEKPCPWCPTNACAPLY